MKPPTKKQNPKLSN